MNGTGRETLQEDYDHANEKLNDFIEAWYAIEFNARDYYPAGPGAWEAARAERDALSAKLREVGAHIEAIREHLYA